jgi:hypothetical protein
MLVAMGVATVLFVLWLGLGALTGAVAQNRGHNGVLWLVLGLVAPVFALVALLVFLVYDPGDDAEHSVPRPEVAARTNPVARALMGMPASRPGELADRVEMSSSAVKGDLRTLRTLGLVEHDGHGRWQLTEAGAASVVDPDLPTHGA